MAQAKSTGFSIYNRQIKDEKKQYVLVYAPGRRGKFSPSALTAAQKLLAG